MKDTQLINVEQSAPTAMLGMIDRVCTDNSFDIQKMKELVAMRNDEIKRLAETEFNHDFAEMQSKLPLVTQKSYNDQTKSRYAKVDDINKVILPILAKYGFAVSFNVPSQDKEGVTVQAVLLHKGGHKISTNLFMPLDRTGAQGTVNKTYIHATGSTITYAKRYALCMLLNISTGEDNDGNNQPLQYITPEQLEEINRLIDESKADKVVFIQKYLGVESLNKLPTNLYKKAVNGLQDKINKNKKAQQKGIENADIQGN